MDSTSVDAHDMNRFISSLSKSLQALCHGCVDFDNGIEIIGYIKVNIDSENSVDCVLNEKVKRSAKTNSMTFVSNSFLAKKERDKIMCDATCSPMPEYSLEPFSNSYTAHPDLNSQKRVSSIPGSRLMHGKRRHREHVTSHHHHTSQGQPKKMKSDTLGYSASISDSTIPEIKQEADERDFHTEPLFSEVKRESSGFPLGEDGDQRLEGERNDDKVSAERILSDNPSPIPSHESEQGNFLSQSQSRDTSLRQSESSSNHQQIHDIEEADGLPDNSENEHEETPFMEGGEGSSTTSHFEVIEIGDDDEEVHGLFPQSGHQSNMGPHLSVGSSHSDFVWNSQAPLSNDLYSYCIHSWREKKRHASRTYRLNRTNEQRERERWLARLRQRRRRAKLRQQMSVNQQHLS